KEQKERPYRSRHLWRELLEKIAASREREPYGCSLACVCHVMEARGKIRVTHEARRCRRDEVGKSRHRTPGIRAIDEGKCESVESARERTAAGRRTILWVFVREDASEKAGGVEGYSLGDGVSVVSPEAFGSLSPLAGIACCALTGRMRHTDTRAQ